MEARDPLQVVRFPMLPPQAQQLERLPPREADLLQEVVGPLRVVVDPSRLMSLLAILKLKMRPQVVCPTQHPFP